ncbi:MAG: hypothetical protein ABL949_06550 [Fimbriimonadaceae bacterium]
MNRFKTTLIALTVVFGAFATAVVQQHGGDMAKHFAEMSKQLGLSPTQEKQMKEQHLIAQKKMEAIQADKKLDKVGKEKAMEQLHKDMLEKAKKFLTAEQVKKLSGMHQIQSAKAHLHGMLSKLNLNADQKKEIELLTKEITAAFEKLLDNNSLTDAQRNEKAQTLHKEALHKIYELLNPDQQQEFAKMLHGG